MKTVVIQASSRAKGDTHQVARLAVEKLSADFIDLLNLEFTGYDYEHRNRADDFLPTMQRIVTYDCILFVTPVYWYTMSGLLKNFLDRISDLLRIEKDTGRQLRGMSMAALSCSNDSEAVEAYFVPFKLSAEYLGMHYLGGLHSWVEAGEVSAESKRQIIEFCQQFGGLKVS